MSLPLVGTEALPWLSVEQMREVDRIMVDGLGISLVRMMENAGRNLAELARVLLGGDSGGCSIAVLVGPGGTVVVALSPPVTWRPRARRRRSCSPQTSMRSRRCPRNSSRSRGGCDCRSTDVRTRSNRHW